MIVMSYRGIVTYATLSLMIVSKAFGQEIHLPISIKRNINQNFTFFSSINNNITADSSWIEAESFSNGLAIGFNGQKWFLIGANGVLSKGYDAIRDFSSRVAAVKNNDKWGYIDINGQLIIPISFDVAFDFSTSGALVYSEKSWKEINNKGIIKNAKPKLSNGKFDERILGSDFDTLSYVSSEISSREYYALTPSVTTSNNCPPNISFESGTFTNWSCFLGRTLCASTHTVSMSPSPSIGGRHTIVNRSAVPVLDQWGRFSINPPDGSSFCVKLGNQTSGAQAERIAYTFNVPANATDYSITYDYAVVFQDPSHASCEQPRFSARLFDIASNTYLSCSIQEYVSDGTIPGFFNSTLDPDVKYKPWTEAFINLSAYQGRQLRLEFTTEDCTQGGHWGYAYIDVRDNCELNASIQYSCVAPHITTLTGPSGFASYKWWNLPFTTLMGTAQSLVLNPGLPIGTKLWIEVTPYNGTSCKDTLPVTITATLPIASFDAPAAQCKNGNLFYFTSTSTYSAGNIVRYDWDFGDNTTGSGNTVTHSYTSANTFIVKLKVTTNTGCIDSTTRTIIVSQSPQVNFNIPTPQCLSGNNFTFTSNSQINGGSIASDFWNFGDSQIGSGHTVTHQYVTSGDYWVKLISVSDNGCVDSIRHQITVNPQPVAIFTLPVNQCLSVNNYTFTSNSTVSTGNITSTTWNFGDNTFSSGVTVDYSYPIAGSYAVKLIVQTNNGCSDSLTRQTTVFADPIVGITSNRPLSFCIGDSTTLTSNSLPGSGIIISQQWINNGIPLAGVIGNSFTVYQSGNYQILVVNSNGCRKTSSIVPVISHPLPLGNLSMPSSPYICDGTSVLLSTSSSGGTYQWYKDGLVLFGATGQTFSANQSGNYTVELISPVGCKNFATGAVLLALLKKPSPNFSFPTYCAGTPIQFSNVSDTILSGPVIWNWKFGDFTSSDESNPTHTYGSGTDYTVILKVTPTYCPSLFNSLSKIVSVEEPRIAVRYPAINAVKNWNTLLQARTFGINYLWTPSIGLNNPRISNPIFNHDQVSDYIIRIQSKAACVTYDTQQVRMFVKSDIQVPRAFTPNGDGHNDKLDVFLIGIAEFRFFRVFNRWGQLLYETKDVNRRWDGIFNGVKQPLETYVWTAEGVAEDGKIISRRGQTVLIR